MGTLAGSHRAPRLMMDSPPNICAPKELGRRLRSLRGERSWSQPDTVERAGLSSVSTLVRIELGQQLPSLVQLPRFAELYETSVCWLTRPDTEDPVLVDTGRVRELERTTDPRDPLWDAPCTVHVRREMRVATRSEACRLALRLRERRAKLQHGNGHD